MNKLLKVKVVMLPTKKATEKCLIKEKLSGNLNVATRIKYGNKFFDVCIDSSPYTGLVIPQHLYFISDEVPNIGDFYIVNGTLAQVGFSTFSPESYCKIIASTDPKLNLPKPSNDFLKVYCVKGGIDEVLVEYQIVKKNGPLGLDYFDPMDFQLKVASDNTITIKKNKNYWNREEVITLITKHSEFVDNLYRPYTKGWESKDQWIEENL